MKESEIKLIVLTKLAPYLYIGFIAFIGIIVTCTDNTNPLDNSINKQIEYVKQLEVLDKNGNGYRVTYVTIDAVTKSRLKEIQSRPHILTAFLRLQRETPVHFGGSLLDTDIHEFARFARQYDCDNQIKIHCIFVHGLEKMNHYIGSNPKIANSAKWFNVNTEQGNQWINRNDVYGSTEGKANYYRYWKCQVPYCISETDEHYSHFSEDSRLR